MVTFDTDGLSPAMLGRLNKHLDRLVRADGEVMTHRHLYTSGRFDAKWQGTVRVWGRSNPERAYELRYAGDPDRSIDVPKLVWDAITLPDVTERAA